MQIKLQINNRKFRRKPTAEEIRTIQKNFVKVSTDIPSLIREILSGKTVKPCVSDGGKLSQQCFFVDVDNSYEFYNVKFNKNRCLMYGIVPVLIYGTFSYTPANQRHRLVFVLDEPVTDETERNLIQQYLCNLFCGDKVTRDKSRIFFGSDNLRFFASAETVSKEKILRFIKEEKDNENF